LNLEVRILTDDLTIECAAESAIHREVPETERIPKKTFLGIGISIASHADVIRFIMQTARSQSKALVNNVNVHAMNIAYRDARFADVLNDSDIVFCDGFGVKVLARLAGICLGERMTPREWIDELIEHCAQERLSLYFLGCEDEVVRAFADEVARRHPRAIIAGFHHGYFDTGGEESRSVITAINDSGADIVLVGMGMPRQEIWAHEALPELDRGIIVAVGALFKVYTGIEKPCPGWLSRCGFEWFWRLAHEPLRLGRRYLAGNVALLLRICYAAFIKRLLGFFLACLLLALCAPVLALFYMLIRLETRGSGLFRQERVGKEGKRIWIYKLRTLKPDFPPYASKRNVLPESTTRVGSFLRRTTIDELPQLINVIRGDMALVGPRPEMPFIADSYRGVETLRLSVNPGLTGPWQIAQLRGETNGREIHEDITYDLNYIRRMGFFLDTGILVQTAFYLAATPFKEFLGARGNTSRDLA
jgi:exopolysaccharide biosynthesis WecB/TagA/CpsF family protein